MTCSAPRTHIVDSRFYSRGYTTEEARQIFCDLRRLQRWLDVEVVLAACQAELGVIPEQAARELERTARLDLLDLDAIQADIARTGHSLIPLLNAWQKIISDEAGKYIHFGATTQDIQDTAQSLEIKDVFTLIERDTNDIVGRLAELAEQYRDLVMIARTHGQQALPTTLGAKIAVWLDEMIRNGDRLRSCRQGALVSQLFGGVGTMAALGDQGMALLKRFSDRLGLDAPLTCWHTSRDRSSDMLSCMAILAGTLGKIANEICQLARDEIGELEEPFHMGKIGSTTMPHKRNPELCEQVVVLAKLVKHNAAIGFETLISEHERDYRSIRLEWAAITDSSQYICGALALMKTILHSLIVHEERIRENVNQAAGLIATEALMFRLGEKMGKQAAHQLLYEISMEARSMRRRSTDRPLVELLAGHPEIRRVFTLEALGKAIDPAHHIGLAGQLTDGVAARAAEWLAAHKKLNDSVPPCPLEKSGICT
ncbi:MAG: adenylosuccinate lyase family protein [Desulfobulbaceae bacterium]|nr:adenylosuccinate lyase family protein [Desulfobulbaceae bacterium]